MSYAVTQECFKCKSLTYNDMKSLPCGLLLCQGCSEKWQCECGLCGDRKRNTLVPRKGLCKLCMEPTSSSEGLCVKCLDKKEVSVWDLLWSLGSKLTCGTFSVLMQEEKPKQVKRARNPKCSTSLATVPGTAEKSVENDEKKSYAIL